MPWSDSSLLVTILLIRLFINNVSTNRSEARCLTNANQIRMPKLPVSTMKCTILSTLPTWPFTVRRGGALICLICSFHPGGKTYSCRVVLAKMVLKVIQTESWTQHVGSGRTSTQHADLHLTVHFWSSVHSKTEIGNFYSYCSWFVWQVYIRSNSCHATLVPTT